VVILTVWEFIYFSYQWAVSGKTLGMAVFGVQVVTSEGAPIAIRQAVLRTLGLALTIATLGIGFLGIVLPARAPGARRLRGRDGGRLDWDARAARLRWMAREGQAHGRKPGGTPPAA
jgi:hypothetical protein